MFQVSWHSIKKIKKKRPEKSSNRRVFLGAYILYTHMMAQRRKVMRGFKAKNEKATQ